MQNSQLNQIFEFCINGDTQPLIDALVEVTDSNMVDNRQNSVLAIAIKHGHWQTCQSLIDHNFTYCNVNKPLLIAACQNSQDDSKGISIALQLNDNIDILNQQQRTALMTVCLLGHIDKAQVLITHGANCCLQDHQGNTALMEAVQSKNKKMVALIISQNPDANQTNHCNETALILELKQKSPTEDIVQQLLDAGSDPEICDKDNKSAWLIAKQKHPKISRLIERHLNNVNQIELPFFSNDYASKETPNTNKKEINSTGNTKNIKETESSSKTPTEKQQTPARIEPTIDNQNSVNISTAQNNLKLNNQAKTNNKEASIAKPIPKATKPFFFNQNKVKKTNLQEWFHAAKTGNLGGLNRMIIDGIDINCTDDKGCTALIRASGHSRRAVVSFLLQQNADIEIRSHNGSTALSSSIIGNCRRVAGLLLDNHANPNGLGPSDYSYATIAAAQWNDAMLSILYRNGSDVFICNKQQQNLLHIVALAAEFYSNVNNAKTSIQFLLDHGMDINTQDQHGNTALMIICGTHKTKYNVDDRNIASIAHCLIKLGAAPAITNKFGKSAMDATKQHKLQQTKGVIMNALSWNDV